MSAKQQINLFSFTMIVVGLVIGMGIFRSAATSASYAITPAVYFTAWILGGLIALCGALTYAEIGSRYPVTGYKLFSYAYHPSIAFAINCIILISNAASLSGVALIGSGYITKLFPGIAWTDIDKALISCPAIIIFYFINLRGLTISSRAQNILMIIKIGMIGVLILALLFPHQGTPITTAPVAPVETGSDWMLWIKSLGVLAYVNALLMSNPRVMYAMSEEGVLPGIFAKKSDRHEVLVASLTVFAGICIIILFFAQTFEKILNFTMFLDCFGMVASSATIFILRKRTAHLDGTGIFKMKLFPWVPLIFMVAYCFVGVSIFMQTPGTALIGLGVLAAFIGIYFITRIKSTTTEK